jgi:hypothetical protein
MDGRSMRFVPQERSLRPGARFVIVSLLRRQRSFTAAKAEENEGVDELSETLHNLSSLLLTNKTIRRIQQGSTE